MLDAAIIGSGRKTGIPKIGDVPLSKSVVICLVLLLGISYSFNGMDRQVFPALLGPIREQYSLTLAQGGFLSTVFAFNIAIFGAGSHWVIGRFGRKATLVGGLIFYSVFTALTPLASDFWTLMVFRGLTGAGEALHIGSVFAIVGSYFGARRGAYLGVVNSFFGVGAFLGPFVGTRLYVAFGSWQEVFFIYGLLGMAAASCVAIVAPARFCAAVDPEPAVSLGEGATPSRAVNRNSVLCLTGYALLGYSFFSYTALYTTYLQQVHGLPIAVAGQCFGMFGIGALSGFVGGWLGEKLKQFGLLIALGALSATGYLMFHGVPDAGSQSMLSLLYGALVSGYLVPRFISLIQRSIAADQIGVAMSMSIPAFYASGTFAGYAFGRLVDATGWETAALLTVALPPALALATCAFVQPRGLRGT